MMQRHFWRGELITDQQLTSELSDFRVTMMKSLRQELLLDDLFDACAAMREHLDSNKELVGALITTLRSSGGISEYDAKETLTSIATFIDPANLRHKLLVELCDQSPDRIRRRNYSEPIFEQWQRLGCLVHASPANSLAVGVLSVIEGLLSRNVNLLKTSSDESLFAQQFFAAFCQNDRSNTLANFIFVVRVSSKDHDCMKQIFALADGVVAWGGEESIQGLKSLAPANAKFIDWGPKISFAYVGAGAMGDADSANKIASDICVYNQQACSSPQLVYVETQDFTKLQNFAQLLASALESTGDRFPILTPSLHEQAEITNVCELALLESCISEKHIIGNGVTPWRIIVENHPGLRASPLFRTIFVKPLPRVKIMEALYPLRGYLQTVGLAGSKSEIVSLSQLLVQAGVQRCTLVGHMHDSYTGEPHDGRYALQAYSRRISFQLDERFRGFASLDARRQARDSVPSRAAIMTKQDFQSLQVQTMDQELFFKSGGSSGAPKLSYFTYEDYLAQMAAAADGLFAAGLDPSKDLCMNLFFGGGLYGGFLSFFTILEHLRARQLPMAAHDDHEFVAKMIIQNNVTTLLGMPSYILHLFQKQESALKKSATVKKIFYGGEHFTKNQRHFLESTFGINLIRSASYGSVDAGPLGYQCPYCEGSVHHLHESLQHLEIVAMESDQPVSPGEAGRLIVTSKRRRGQKIERYDIGDLGRWIPEQCPCERNSPRFELLGRHGDIVRVGTMFLSYQKIVSILDQEVSFNGEAQMVISRDKLKASAKLLLSSNEPINVDAMRSIILQNYPELAEVMQEGLLDFTVKSVNADLLTRTPGSGKLRHLLEQ